MLKERIVEIQKEYFYKDVTKDINFRIEQLSNLKNAIKKHEDELIKALFIDLNKSEFESYATEIGLLYEEIEYFIKNIRKISKVKKVKTSKVHYPSDSYIMYEPKGVVYIISPWNYPVQLLLMPLIGSIAAGNCNVLKPSEKTPHVADVLEKIINNYFKNEYIYLVRGDRELSNTLLRKSFDHIFFTGSQSVGKHVMKLASENLVPLTLELGGKSPCIVDETANIQIAAKRIVWGKTLNAGQTCVAPDYVYVHKSVKSKLIEEISNFTLKIFGNDMTQNSEYPKIVNDSHFDRLINLLEEGRILFGGNYNKDNLKIGFTLIDKVDWNSSIMDSEVFGPLLPIIEYEDINKIIENLKRKDSPLALYLFTNSKLHEDFVLDSLSFGGGCINDTVSHVSNNNLPFGGVGKSGMGKYHGQSTFYALSNEKIIMKKSTKIDPSLKYHPYTNNKIKILRKLIK
ncbi:aldehyde dehydrogenase [Helicovermis profundi]|uniref:Aldehyde dehydrogenase n=1 Tax=Helicovermis profundi TaxID=3065157 RepID=A0AAU9ELL3_9FIRM|nr:aldehyde dehydrogenase [Clostridia bacterium S502]